MTSFMSGNSVSLLICALLSIATPVLSQTASGNTEDQRLIEIEHQLNEADAHHNADQASKYLDDDYLVKSMEGKVYDKSAALASIRLDADAQHESGQSQPAPIMDSLKTAVLDGSALVVFNVSVDLGKQALHCRMADTFLKRSDDWKLVGRSAICH